MLAPTNLSNVDLSNPTTLASSRCIVNAPLRRDPHKPSIFRTSRAYSVNLSVGRGGTPAVKISLWCRVISPKITSYCLRCYGDGPSSCYVSRYVNARRGSVLWSPETRVKWILTWALMWNTYALSYFCSYVWFIYLCLRKIYRPYEYVLIL